MTNYEEIKKLEANIFQEITQYFRDSKKIRNTTLGDAILPYEITQCKKDHFTYIFESIYNLSINNIITAINNYVQINMQDYKTAIISSDGIIVNYKDKLMYSLQFIFVKEIQLNDVMFEDNSVCNISYYGEITNNKINGLQIQDGKEIVVISNLI